MNNAVSMIDILTERYTQDPDRIIYRFLDYQDGIWKSQDITMAQLYVKSLSMAHTLKRKGLRKGDRAIIFSMQDFGTIFSIFGCMMAGVTFTIIPPPLDEGKTERFISVLKSCQPKALISNYELEQSSGTNLTGRLLREAFSSVLRLKRIYSDRVTPYKRKDVIVPTDMHQLVYLQYTSGSTNAPKGVRVTQKALMKNLEQICTAYDFNHTKLGTWVPFFHNLGLVVTIFTPVCMTHATSIFLQTLQFLSNPKLWMKMVSDFKINVTLAPGSAYDACTRIFSEKEAASFDLSHVTHFLNGSEFISPKTVDAFLDLFKVPRNTMAPGYGLAENVCLVTLASNDYRTAKLDMEAYQKNKAVLATDENCKEIAGVGIPVKDLNVVIGNPKTGKVYEDMQIGEIFISGDSVADGYWGNLPDNKNFHIRMDGYDKYFYKTGDLGFLSEGELYITGRIKEMLIVNGHNIFPSDIHLLLQQKILGISSSSIGFFSSHDGTKEQIICVIEASPEEDFEERVRQINAAVSERFGFSFYDIIFVPFHTLPRTDNNKLQTLKAKAMYQEGMLQVLHSSRAYRMSGGNPNLIDKSIEVADEILMQVKSIFEKILNIEQYSLHASFLELGGDSLKGFELMNKVEQNFHIKLDLREMLKDSSVSGVASYVKSVISGGKTTTGKTLILADECKLEECIRITGHYEKPVQDCRKIFLTGATGFLGAQLISSIISQYPHDGLEIHCLVRADSQEAGLERLVRNMKRYECWDESFRPFLHPVLGDLSSPYLGMVDDTYQKLSGEIEVIYHNGALLNFVFPYEYLKTTNVTGTVETLRLACTGKPKYYHFVSSYSVYDTPNNTGKHMMENDPLEYSKGFALAYSETKWVSEKMIGIARKRGLLAVIYRPGDITGASNGLWEMEDMVSRMIVGAIQMGSIPRTQYCMHMTPVDYVGKAIVHISRKPEAIGQAFNIINPRPTPLKEIVAGIRAYGYQVKYAPFLVWRKRLKEADSSENSLTILECLFEAGTENNPGVLRHFMGKDTTYDVSNTALLLNGSGITCPPIDKQMIAAYLTNFKKSGNIK